ncbi:MAG: Hsp20/alpha crystallin family protein [Halobacteriales archaeon]|nr:Hsp20/alpha crystallin family protein [Halobacteriales archaeon]
MRRNPDDPFDDLFRQLEQFMEDVMEQGGMHGAAGAAGPGAAEPTGTDTHIDVHEYDDYLTVIADLPGVEKADIDVSCNGTVLSIQAENDGRRYDERLQLPATVDETTGSAKYNNGVLEVRFDRAGDSASIDVE